LSLETWSRSRDESQDPFLEVSVCKVSGLVSVSVAKVSGLETLNIAKKRFIEISLIQRFVFVVFAGEKQPNYVEKMLEICKKFKSEVMTTFLKTLPQNTQIFKSRVLNFKSHVSVLVSEFLMKSRSRFKFLTRSRSRSLRSRLHNWSRVSVSNFQVSVYALMTKSRSCFEI